jgi:hypothetical protein
LPKLEFLKQALLPGTRVLEGMQTHTYSLLPVDWQQEDIEQARESIKRLLKKVFLEE